MVTSEQIYKGDRVLLAPCCSRHLRQAIVLDNRFEKDTLVRDVLVVRDENYEEENINVFVDEIRYVFNSKGVRRVVKPSQAHIELIQSLRLRR